MQFLMNFKNKNCDKRSIKSPIRCIMAYTSAFKNNNVIGGYLKWCQKSCPTKTGINLLKVKIEIY